MLRKIGHDEMRETNFAQDLTLTASTNASDSCGIPKRLHSYPGPYTTGHCTSQATRPRRDAAK
jgi:hypothetical protein